MVSWSCSEDGETDEAKSSLSVTSKQKPGHSEGFTLMIPKDPECGHLFHQSSVLQDMMRPEERDHRRSGVMGDFPALGKGAWLPKHIAKGSEGWLFVLVGIIIVFIIANMY